MILIGSDKKYIDIILILSYLKIMYVYFLLASLVLKFLPCYTLPLWEEAEMQVSVRSFSYKTDHFWNKNGRLKPSYNDFKQWQMNLWVEYSPFDSDIFALRGYYDSIQESMNGNTRGFGDAEFSWAHRIADTYWSRVMIIIPTGKEKASLRYGRLGIEADLFYSNCFTLFNFPIGTLCGVGYRAYYGFPSDQLRAYLDLTSHIYSNLYWFCRTQLEYGVFNGKRQEHFNQIVLNPNYRLFKVQLSLVGFLANCVYFDVGYFQHIWGENVGNNGGVIGGLGVIF